ncbi:MAG TPA: hypothetical protein VHC69_03970 [Polyangiaceae bacterium]|nr:hypothetical protein [Polyangiaceae bacterium]
MRTARIHLDASLDLGSGAKRSSLAPAPAAFPLAVLVAAASLAGIYSPATYARETAAWAAQGIAQDWFDLLFTVPWLLITGALALRGSARAAILLAGGASYVLYEFVIYAFAVHFNAVFLVYCATLGLSFFSTIAAIGFASRLPPPVPWSNRRRGLVGGFLVLLGAMFAATWLAEILPALAKGTTPSSIIQAGLMTNPVHVMDLSIVLPIHFAVGIAVLYHRRRGVTLAPIVLAFDLVMTASIAAMMLLMRARGSETSAALTVAMGALSVASAALLGQVMPRRAP